MATVGLTPSYIEKIHDELVGLRFPETEPVGHGRNLGLIQSAANRPFQSAGGIEIYPGLFSKAAALFHAINASHVFENGCKRTSIIAVDAFLSANFQFLAMSGDDLHHQNRRSQPPGRDPRSNDFGNKACLRSRNNLASENVSKRLYPTRMGSIQARTGVTFRIELPSSRGSKLEASLIRCLRDKL